MSRCDVRWLGCVEFRAVWETQQRLAAARLAGEIPDTLLIVEHPPVITLGKSARPENVRATAESLKQAGIDVIFTDRGGDVTYHGPGQLVGYPIVDLREREKNIRDYVYGLEEVIIDTLRDFNIKSERDAAHPGVWVDNSEIAAIGIRIKKWITMHGFALNVNTDLKGFNYINPCGFSDRGATAMAVLLGREVPLPAVRESLIKNFARVYKVDIGLPIMEGA